MTADQKRTLASCDEDVQERNLKRRRINVEMQSEKHPIPQPPASLPLIEPSDLASEGIPDQIEFDIKPMKVIFDYMSNQITKLSAEKADYKKKFLEQEKIANSLSTQINDNHSLVTESSIVKELQNEIVRRRHAHRYIIDYVRQCLRDLDQERQSRRDSRRQLIDAKILNFTKERNLRLQQMERDNAARLMEVKREMAWMEQRMTREMNERRLAHCNDIQAYRDHILSSYQTMLNELERNNHGGENSDLGQVLKAFQMQINYG